MALLEEAMVQAMQEVAEAYRKQQVNTWYPGKQMTSEERKDAYIRRLEKQNAELSKQVSDMNWIINPDRMGGAFSQQEIEESRRGGHGW